MLFIQSFYSPLFQCSFLIIYSYYHFLKIHTSHDSDIEKDAVRTFSLNHQFHRDPENLKRLRRVLHCTACHNSAVGYTQGMNFLIGNLLLLFPEETVFWIFESLCKRYRINELFTRNMPLLKIVLYQLERVLQIFAPDVFANLEVKNIPIEIFGVQWFATLFAADLGLEQITLVWEIFLLKRWKFLFRLAIALLRQMAPQIEVLEYESLLVYIKTFLPQKRANLDLAITEALKIKISNSMLELLEKEYYSNNPEIISTACVTKKNLNIKISKRSPNNIQDCRNSKIATSSGTHLELKEKVLAEQSFQEDFIEEEVGSNDDILKNKIFKSPVIASIGKRKFHSPFVAKTPHGGHIATATVHLQL